MKEETQKIPEGGVIQCITPVPYTPLRKPTEGDEDLVVVSISSLLKAQKEHNEELKQLEHTAEIRGMKRMAVLLIGDDEPVTVGTRGFHDGMYHLRVAQRNRDRAEQRQKAQQLIEEQSEKA